MTVIPSLPLKRPRLLNARGLPRVRDFNALTRHGWYQWSYYVVPSSLLRDFILPKFDGQECWKEQYYLDISRILRNDPKVVARRMRDVFGGFNMITKADLGEAAVMALGYRLDDDTNIPALPGTVKLARELIQSRADTKLDELTLQRYVHRTHRICALILGYPHNSERLLDLAPFDCLRPPR